VLSWRKGDWSEAERWCRRGHELAEQVGWSEVSFSALYWLARALRDRGDHAAAVTELDHALDVCERAGLIAQSIEAMAARAITLAIAGRVDQGRETAEEAGHLADRLHYPVGEAAALEARATTASSLEEGMALMGQARELWDGLGRPLDVAICDLLLGHMLVEADHPTAVETIDRAAAAFERLGVGHLSRWARAIV
jgi:tetratricopeptide (TPR) repeat protein